MCPPITAECNNLEPLLSCILTATKLHNIHYYCLIIYTSVFIMTYFGQTRMYLAMSKMLAQCGLFLSQSRGYRKSGSGCLAFRRLKNLRSYLDHQRRALACSPKCRYDVPFSALMWHYLKLVLQYIFRIDNFSAILISQIKQMMEAATKQIEERKKQLSITSASPVSFSA